MEREDNRAQWKETERSNVGDIKILSIRITNCMDSQTVHKSVGNRTRKSKPIYYRLSNKKVTCNVCVMCTTVINSTCRTDLELYCVNSFFFLSLSNKQNPKAKWCKVAPFLFLFATSFAMLGNGFSARLQHFNFCATLSSHNFATLSNAFPFFSNKKMCVSCASLLLNNM